MIDFNPLTFYDKLYILVDQVMLNMTFKWICITKIIKFNIESFAINNHSLMDKHLLSF